MPLPSNVNQLTKTINLPVSGVDVKFRSFVVGEEKVLLMIRDQDDVHAMVDQVTNVIKACTFNKIDPNEMPAADMDYLFLHIRALSKGNTSKVAYECGNKLEDGSKCGRINEYTLDLTEIPVQQKPEFSKKIEIESTDYIAHFKVPTYKMSTQLVEYISKNPNVTELDVLSKLCAMCLDCVTQGDEVFSPETEEETLAWLDQLPGSFFEQFQEKFADCAPALRYTLHTDCKKCGYQEDVELSGIEDFF